MSLPIIFISGPTAIGKSELALNLAKKTRGEIINADSMQVYKELKILTARPSYQDQKKIPHHLYGHICAKHRYNVAEWCKEAISIIKKNNQKNKLTIVVGGTGLYIKTLLSGITNIPQVSEEYKEQSNKLLLDLGIEKFYFEVYKIDKYSCEKISKNDTQRLKRIWEVYQATGKTLSEWNVNKRALFLNDINYRFYLFIPPRKEIYTRVNKRFLLMIENGVIEEVKNLLSLNLNSSLPIMKAHGVPEIAQYLLGSINLENSISKAQQVTRNYVKRQVTWWKSIKINNITLFRQFPSDIDLELLNFSKNIN